MVRSSHDGKGPDSAARPNTIGLRGRDLAELLDELDTADPVCDGQRDFVRWPFRYTSLRLDIVHPGGNITSMRVACRNLSRGGMSILHSAFLHPGSRCSIFLPHPRQGEVALDGWVVRCHHRSGMVHEIGIAFARNIDVHAFVPALRGDMFSLERIDAQALTGSLLYFSDGETTLRIFRHHLRQTALRIAVNAAAQPPPGPFDLLVACHPLEAEQGASLAKLRAHERPPLLILTDDAAHTAPALAALRPDAVLARPVAQQDLLRGIAEFLIVRPRQVKSAEQGVDPRAAAKLAHIVQHCARRLEEALARRDAAACRALCVQIAGAAPALGLRGLGRQATQAADELTRTQSVHDSGKAIRALIGACQRAHGKAA
jgi:hypothetical protein